MVADYAWRIGRNQLVRANHGGQKTQKTHVALIPYLRPYKSCCSCKAAVRFAHGHAIGDDTESPLCHCERATKKIDNFLGLFGPLTLISPPNSASPYLCFSTSVWPVARRFLVLMVLRFCNGDEVRRKPERFHFRPTSTNTVGSTIVKLLPVCG